MPTDTCVCTLSADTVRSEDSGQWRCEIVNKHGKSSATCNVKVIETDQPESENNREKLPTFLRTLENVVTETKSTVDLVCFTDPGKFVQVKWFRNDLPVEPETMDRYRITSVKGELKLCIIRAKPKDTGVFKCRIENEVGWTSCDCKVVVKEELDENVHESRMFDLNNKLGEVQRVKDLEIVDTEADTLISSFADTTALKKFLIKWQKQNADVLEFAIHLKNRCVVEGCTTVMGCLVNGLKPYTVKWYKGVDLLEESGKYFVNEKNGLLSLTINRLKVGDTGNYTCTVRNDQTKIASSCYLQVEPFKELSKEVPTKPTFLTPLKRTTVNEGETIWLKARVKAYPPPGFKWFKDGLEIQDSPRIQSEVIENRGVAQLVITGATVRDIGLYTLEAHNLAGRAKSMVRISVRDKYEEELWRAVCAKQNGIENGDITDGLLIDSTKTVSTTTMYTSKVESELSEQVPVLKTQLPNTVKVEGRERFLLELYCDGHPLPTVQWFRNGNLIVPGKRHNILSVGNWFGLEVLNPEPRDAGSYTFKAVNSSGRVASTCEVDIDLLGSKEEDVPAVVIESADELTKESTMFIAGQSETEGDNFRIAEIVPSFHLCNTEADWTTNIDKEVEIIDADEAPSFPHGLPEHLSPHENDENVMIMCQVRGEPIPKIVWLKDGKDLEVNGNITVNMDPKTRIASLTIAKATMTDSGTYSCVANGVSGGHASTTSNIQILPAEMTVADHPEASTDEKSAPEFKQGLRDKNLQEGSDVKLECRAEGFPIPKVNWYKNDEMIKATIGKYTMSSTVEGSHTLIIANVHVSDSDCYKCEAVNEVGAVTTSAHVVVHEQSEVDGALADVPQFKISLHSFSFSTGETAMLRCVATGQPVPNISWRKDNVALEDGDRVTIETESGESLVTLKNLKPEDAGQYICCAENDKGKVESSATLKCKETPEDADEKGAGLEITVTEEHDMTESVTATQSEYSEYSMTTTGFTTDDDFTSTISAEQSLKSLSVSTNVSRESSVDFTKAPKIVMPPMSTWLVSGKPLKFELEFTKSPDVVINWFHNEQPIDKDRFVVEVTDKAAE